MIPESLVVQFARWMLGTPFGLPDALLAQYPDLSDAQYRRGGIVLRVGGWCLGRASVSGITLWRTIWISSGAPLEPELLLHELRHVHQFQSDPLFPLRYVWRSLRDGYTGNPYEADARAYAAERVGSVHPTV